MLSSTASMRKPMPPMTAKLPIVRSEKPRRTAGGAESAIDTAPPLSKRGALQRKVVQALELAPPGRHGVEDQAGDETDERQDHRSHREHSGREPGHEPGLE